MTEFLGLSVIGQSVVIKHCVHKCPTPSNVVNLWMAFAFIDISFLSALGRHLYYIFRFVIVPLRFVDFHSDFR
jgi:hypothetical protein